MAPGKVWGRQVLDPRERDGIGLHHLEMRIHREKQEK